MTRSDLALAALASAAVPGMKPVSVVGVRAAHTEDAPRYQVAHVTDATERTWVIRVPLNPAAGAAIEHNDALLQHLSRHVPFKVPAPAGYATVGSEGRAAVYPYVEGSALNLSELPDGQGLASAVGRSIAAVHNIPREVFEDLAVPVFSAAEVRTRRLTELDRAAETGLVPTGLLARWEEALNATPMWQFTATPVHGRLDGDAFLVAFSDPEDSATGRVVGLTAWDEARVGDPAEDFADLATLSSPEAFDAAIDAYSLARSQRPDGYLIYRARLASEMRVIAALKVASAVEDRDGAQLIAERLRRLDRLTTGDESLVPRTALVLDEPRWREDDSDHHDDDDGGDSADEGDAAVVEIDAGDIDEQTDAGDIDGDGDEEIDPDSVTEVSFDDATADLSVDEHEASRADEQSEHPAIGAPGDADSGADHVEDADRTDVTVDLAQLSDSGGEEDQGDGTDHGAETLIDNETDDADEAILASDVDAESDVDGTDLDEDQDDESGTEPRARVIAEPDPTDRTEEIPLNRSAGSDADLDAAPSTAETEEDRDRLRTLYDMPDDFPDADLDDTGLDDVDDPGADTYRAADDAATSEASDERDR